MPRAGDAFLVGQLPRTHDPMIRINTNPPVTEITLQDLIDNARRWFTEIGIPLLSELLGVDLEVFIPFANGAFDSIEILFGPLNPLSGEFNPLAAIQQFLALMVQVGATLPQTLLGTSVQTLMQNVSQQVTDAIVSALSGIPSVGNDPSQIVWSAFTAPLSIGSQLLDQLFGALAGLQAQVTGIQNQVATSLVDDFLTTGVTNYTNIVGTLALSTRGRYIQLSTATAAYRTASLATDRHGAQITIDAKMQGSCMVAICSDTAATNFCGLEVYSGYDGDALRIVTGSSPTVTAIEKQLDISGASRLQNGNTFDIWYDTVTNTFNVLMNGLGPVLQWTDTGNTVTHDATHRKVVVVSNVADTNIDGFYGPAIRRVAVYDK